VAQARCGVKAFIAENIGISSANNQYWSEIAYWADAQRLRRVALFELLLTDGPTPPN
jgi:hypothetical protein